MATSGTFSGSNNDEAAVFAFVLEPSSTPPPVNDGTAATAFGWGTPLGQSDEFEYTGSPNSTKWSVLSGAGRDGKGTRSPARATVSNGKLVLDALATGETAALEQKFDQQYGRWEIRARAVESAPPPGGGGSSQTLGVGGVATPPGAIVATGDTTARLNIGPAQSGTAGNPRVYDGKGFSVGRITISAGTSYVTVQNYRVNADGQYAIYVNPPGSGSKSHHITIQNNDVRNIHGPGDLNAITIFGDDIKILFNTVVDNWIVGDPGGSHSDCIQSWNNDPNESSSRVWIIGNKFTAPRQGQGNPIHQCIMAQGKAATDGGGGGTGESTDWYISDNEFAADWNQDVKLEDIDNSVVTRNRFTGASTRAIEIRSTSTNTRFYSDNVVGSGYGSVGATITAGAGPPSPLGNTSGPDPVGASYHPILTIRPTATTPGGGGTGTTTGGTGGPQTDRTSVAYTNPAGTASVGHIYAGGLDWTKSVGLLFYTDGSGEFGLANPSSTYLLGGTNGLIAVAKKHNMVLVTPRAPGGGCDDGDGVCWYDSSGSMNIPTKIKWADDFIRNMVLTKYNIDTSRVVISGYSSGAQFTSEYYGPQYAWAWMTDGLLLSISYGGSPKVTAGYPTAFKQKVAAVWDVGANDSAYQGDGNFDAQSGYDAYVSLGFTTTELNVVPNLGHDRDGQFGAVVDREIAQHVSAAGTGTAAGGDGGEYDFFETAEPGGQPVQAFLRYPRDTALPVQQEAFTKSPVDTSQFHNYAFEWTPDHVKGFIDGVQWFVAGGGATTTRRNLQAMLSGHLAILLDNFDGTTQNPASFEVEWARVYSLTPSGGGTGPQTISLVGIPSRQAFGTALVTGGNTSPPPGSVPTLLGINTVLGGSTLGYTQGEGEPPPPGTQVVRPFGISTGQAFGLPQFTVPDGPGTLLVTGIPSAQAFGRPTVIAGPPAAPAPGGVLVPALYAVGSDGTTLTPIPSWTKIRVSPVRNSAGSLTIEYPAGAPGFKLLHDSVSASPLKALEIRLWLGGNNTFALGGWLVQKSGDDLTPGSSWQFTGHFHEWLLTKAIIGPQAISEANKTGSLNFAGANPGLILTTIMDQAQARGALPYMTRDFTTTHDSNGQVWAKSISSLKLAPKTTVFDVVNKLFELGMAEFEVTPGRVWRVFNPEGQGTDRTVGGSPLIFAQAKNLSEHARRESSRDAGTAVLVAGSEGFYKFVSSATAQAQLGWRAEVGADAGQLTSQAAVDAVAESYLEKARAGVAEYSSAIEFGPGERLPMIDYKVGDWAYTSTTSGRRRLRIAQIELEFGVGAPPRGKVVQNDLITDRLTALYRKLAAISTGDAVVGTSEPTPGGLGEDTNPPAAPIGVTVSSTFAYQIPGDATTYAEVAVGWQAVNTNLYADEVIAGKVRAAEIIGGRLRAAADPIFEDWTWGDAPEIVTLHNDALLEEFKSDVEVSDDFTLGPEALAWLTAYPASRQGGGAITADVSHYVVQYQYLGQSGTGGFFDPRNPDAEFGFWGTAEGSPTPNTLLIFGGVTGGRAVGVRVAAVDNAGNQGPFSDVVGTMTAVDDVPPPSPSKPGAKGGFRTVQVTWDGKGSSGEDMVLAAADILSGGGVEIHIAEGIDFTPERPIGPNGKVDLSASSTYQNTFYDAGSLTFAGFENGVTYFVRLVSVDRNGNASDPSETSDGATPNKLVTIDYGPDTIDRATIRAAAIGSAEIDLLAVNESHIGSVNASSITTGIMSADIAVAGRFATPLSSTGNQLEFDSAGIRLSRGGSIVGRWQVFDASMLVTGQYQTAMTGQRVVINPGSSQPDTIRFYPTFTDAYSSIDSVDFAGGTIAGIRIVGSGTSAVANRGMLLIRDQYASMVHGRTDLSYWGSEIWVEQAFTRNKSAAVDLIVDERLTSQFGPRRVAMIHYNANGQPINATGLYYKKTGAFGGEPMLYANGQDVGLVFGGTDGVTSSRILVRSNDNSQFREIAAGAFTVSSSQEVKYGIRGLDTDPVEHLRCCSPKHFRRHGDLDADPERLGFIAEEMPNEVRQSIEVQPTEGGPPEVIETIDLAAVMALDWAATQQIEKRLSAVERWIKGKKEPNA